MKFTDIFVQRPVLSLVLSMLILVLGGRAIFGLPVSQYPETENAIVTISTTYYGADAETVAGFITQPLENVIAQANGIDYITSSSTNSLSTITVNLRLNYDYNRAMTEMLGYDAADEVLAGKHRWLEQGAHQTLLAGGSANLRRLQD